MKKSFFVHILVMLAAVFIAGNLALFLHSRQEDAIPVKDSISRVPFGGFHKFASDIEWMRFINYMGGLKTINDDNKDEVVKRLDKILSLDPTFGKAYHMGALSLSNASPEKAVEFLKRACDSKDSGLKTNWRIPFLAGFILMHYSQPANYSEAAVYFEKALERSGQQPEDYVVNCYLRAKGRAKNSEFASNSKLLMLDSLYSEWKKSNTDMLQSSLIPNLNERLLKAAREARISEPDNKKVQALVTEISSKLMSDKHLCPSCLSNIAPGEKYCSNCGLKVQLYGTCVKCGAVMKGRFCANCGNDAGK